MSKKILIKNAQAVVTCDDFDNVFRDCDILIDGPKIIQIGKDINCPDSEQIKAKGKFVYPGLINTHHHFFQTFVRNLDNVDYINLHVVDWLEQIYPIFQYVNEDVIYYSTLTALADLIKHGCTCAFDHQYCYTKASGKNLVDRQMEVAEMLGIRYHAGRGTNTLPKSQGSTIPDNMLETTDEFLNDCVRLIDLYHDNNPFSMKQIVMAPCQPINSYKETFSETVTVAREHGVYMHTHLGEGEYDLMRERWGKDTLEWCADIGFIGKDVWYAHSWEVTPQQYKLIADNGSGIAHCPSPAILGGFGILDIKALQTAGVNVSLGVDGSATNDSSNLLDSLRTSFFMQAWHSKQRNGAVGAYDMLKVATRGGAAALGRPDLGSLEVGKAADLFMIDAETLELTGTRHNPGSLLARVAVTGPVWMTMINGKIVFKDNMLLGIDEYKLAEEGEKICDAVFRGPCEAFHKFC